MNRKIAPKFIQPDSLPIQLPQVIELENGAKLYWINDVKDASIKLDIEWCAGSKYQDKKLVANYTNKLLLAGTDSRSATAISADVDFYGGYVQHEIDRDHAGLTLYGLSENISDIFKVFSEAFLTAEFPLQALNKENEVASSHFKIEEKKVKTICRKVFTKGIFGETSAYGQLAEISDFNQVTREDLIAFYNEYYMSCAPTIFLVGNVDATFIEQLREWSKAFSPSKKSFDNTGLEQKTGRIDIPVEDAIQSAIRFGRLIFDKLHPDYFQFQLLNTILGGYFGSRLMTNIREDKGYTYGIGSSQSVMEHAAYFYITTEVGVDVREQAIEEIWKEIELLKTVLITEEELTKVKNYMLGDFLRHADGAIAMMENFKNIHFNHLKETYYSDFITAVNNATAEDLMRLANKYWQKEDLLVVTAG